MTRVRQAHFTVAQRTNVRCYMAIAYWDLEQYGSGMDHAICLLVYVCTHGRAKHTMTVLSLNGDNMAQDYILAMTQERQGHTA